MQAIAIVGMACRYPDARSPQELWENALAQRRAFRKIPSERLNLDDYYHPDRNMPDRTYSSQGAFLTDYIFDRDHFRIAGKTYRSSDLTHWLALDIAEQAFADAGFSKECMFPSTSTGVLVGNTLTGEFSRAQLLRLRWPYVARVVTHALLREGWQSKAIQNFLVQLEQEYKRPFAPVGEETLAGGLSNTIAGRICNYFNLKGGGYTVDGACSSSLLALVHACKALESFDLDVALAGGVDLSIDPFEIIGFAKTEALAAEEMRVYDLHSHGFLPGEGCGFVVLMRYEDALAQNCRIYAVIRGWGISSDGSGGITRPEVEGQHLALKRAYQRSGLSIDTIPYFEGHGTGTEVGDATELQALAFTWDQVANLSSSKKAYISSIKANIGHTKAAAGIAGLIKATMAVSNQIIPPTTGMVEPHRELTRPHARLQALQQGTLWPVEAPLRAGISSMGFGGINTHIVLEGVAQERRHTLTSHEQRLLTSFQDAELLLLRATDTTALQEQIAQLLSLAPHLSCAELTDLAAFLASHLQPGPVRAALVVSKPREFEQRLKQLQEIISAGALTHIDPKSHVYLGHGTVAPRITFLFPGQGAPSYLSGGILRSCFREVDALYLQADLPEHADGKRTEIAQPAITTASLAGLIVLEKLGVQADIGLGHSLGELTALQWAGVIDAPALLRLARARGAAMAQVRTQEGAMLSVQADVQAVRELIRNTPVVLAGLNSPRQTVVAGGVLSVNKIAARAHAMGFPCVRLAVSHAFHSPLVAPAVDMLAASLRQECFAPARRTIVSTVTGDFVKNDHIEELLCTQVTAPVRFLEAVERIESNTDLFIEVGPGKALTKLLADITQKPGVATNAGSPSISGMLSASAAAFVLGTPINTSGLFAHRFTRPIDLNWNPSFLINPCEQAPLSDIEHTINTQENTSTSQEVSYHSPGTTLELVRQIIATRTELSLELLELESRMLSDLHLNSITVGQILAEACRALGIARSGSLLQYADARLGEIVQALEDLQQQSSSSADEQEQKKEPDGLSPWIRCFSVIEQEQALSAPLIEQEPGDWQIFAPRNYRFTQELTHAIASLKGVGSIVCLPVDLEAHSVDLLLQGAQAAIARQEATHFVLIQHGSVGAAFARTLYLEHPRLTVCIIHLPLDLPSLTAYVAAEVRAATGFVEVSYNLQGKRTEPVLVPCAPTVKNEPLMLGSNDVLLVTGGGKGIAAECAFALAQETGVKLALLGRSHPQHDPILAEHLAKLKTTGIHYHYVSMDVQDTAGIAQAIHEIEARLGSITAILHGAGVNDPALLSTLNKETLKKTIAPKVRGLENILSAISPQRIKYLIAFGSIIARTGMQGEAHYALANEWLGDITEAFQRAYPACFCLCIEWSVWSGAGMGERLGRVEALRAEGIMPIPVEAGIALFRQLLSQRQTTARIIVSGRFSTIPTLKMATWQLPFLRFLEKPLIFYPGVELVVDVEMSTTTDLYLHDHQLKDERLVPAVIGLEAMAQIATAVTGKQIRPSFTDVQFVSPLVIPEQRSVTLRIMALVQHDGSVEVAIRCSETSYQSNHFQAVCHFSQQSVDQRVSLQWPVSGEAIVPLQLPDDLYGQLLFHRGRFQRILRYTYLHARECIAEIAPYTSGTWFARYLPSEFILGDPASRDAIIHAIQACIPQATLLPVRVESLSIAEQPFVPREKIRVYARERERQGDSFIYDVEARNSDGQLLEQWSGLHLRLVGALLPHERWAEVLLGPYFERRIPEFYPQMQLHLVLHRAVNASLAVNLNNSDRESVRIDIVVPRSRDDWNNILSTQQYELAEQLAEESLEDFDSAATRVLAASEVLKKVAFPLDIPLVLVRAERDGWQILEAGPYVLMTFVTRVRSQLQPLAFIFCHQNVTGVERLNLVVDTQRG